MKKLAIASIIALCATAASALDVGVTATRDFSATDRSGYGITAGKQFGSYGVTGGAEYLYSGATNVARYTVVGNYNFVKVGPVTISGRAGLGFITPSNADSGYIAVAGVGATMPINKEAKLFVNVMNQTGQARVDSFNGNSVTAGVTYAF